MNDLSESVIFNKGGKMPEPYNRYFIGQAYLQMLVNGDKEFNCPIGNVTFEPGCRNNWHRHPGGQILLVTGGRGWYQEDGKEARELKAGDVIKIFSQSTELFTMITLTVNGQGSLMRLQK